MGAVGEVGVGGKGDEGRRDGMERNQDGTVRTVRTDGSQISKLPRRDEIRRREGVAAIGEKGRERKGKKTQERKET